MDSIQKFTLILFKLPNGQVILQRRTKDAPYGAGLLGIFGGWVEIGETVDDCLVREIKEETSLDTESLNINFIKDFIIPASKDFEKDRHFFLYDAIVENAEFEVYEGEGAEAYSVDDLRLRDDLTGSAQFTFQNIL